MSYLGVETTLIFAPSGNSLDETLSQIDVETINVENITVTGTISLVSLSIDDITPETPGAGVTVDGINMKTETLVAPAVEVAIISATGATTGVSIVPTGGAPFMLDIPDNTDVGGNERGLLAVDLQMSRADAARVASGTAAVISGGYDGAAAGDYSVVVGGFECRSLQIGGISGGITNVSNGQRAIAFGGSTNNATANDAIVVGGTTGNASAAYATIIGGSGNNASGIRSMILMGEVGVASADYAIIIGGDASIASAVRAVCIGGLDLTAAGVDSMCIGGDNCTANGLFATILNGNDATADGDYTLAYGRNVAATNNGSVVFADSTGTPTASSLDDQVTMFFNNGYRFASGVFGAGGISTGDLANDASGIYSAVIGGSNCSSSGTGSATLGGTSCSISTATQSAVVAGNTNLITAGVNAAIVGGQTNTISASNSIIIGGRSCTVAFSDSFACGNSISINHTGNVIFTDDQAVAFNSVVDDEFACRFVGGYRLTEGVFKLGDSSLYIDHSNTVQTVGATSQSLYLYTTTADTSYLINIDIAAKTAAGDTAVFKSSTRVKNVAGAVTVGTPFLTGTEADAAINTATAVVAAAGGAVIAVTVTGVAAQTIEWGGTFAAVMR